MPSAITPTPPTTVPPLYRGNPPGSAERPSGVRFGPASAAPPANRRTRSPHGSELNCTPLKGPLDASGSAGLKCSCTIWLAVRVLKALPSLERYAPVTAFAMAASVEGTMFTPSSPPSTVRPGVRTVNVFGAPFIANTPSTLPTRSTTAMVAGALRACASATARASTSCTSAAVRNELALAHDPSQLCGVSAATSGGALPLPPPPHPATSSRLIAIDTIPGPRILILDSSRLMSAVRGDISSRCVALYRSPHGDMLRLQNKCESAVFLPLSMSQGKTWTNADTR